MYNLIGQMKINSSGDFIYNFEKELAMLEQEGFFSGNNWTYTAKDILVLYDKLPDNLKKECVNMYPKVTKRVQEDLVYIDENIVKNNPELEHFLDKFHGKGSYDKISSKMEEDLVRKRIAASTGMARYYIFFLLIMNSSDENYFPRIVIDNVKSFKNFLKVVHGFPLVKNLQYLSVQGNVTMKRLIEYKNKVEIIVDPTVEYTLAGESILNNIRLRVDNKGQIIEEKI